VLIERSSLHGNRAGGLGVAQAKASAEVGGAHIAAEGGHVTVDSCSVTGDDAEGASLQNPAQWWLGTVQSLVLRNSSFRSATPGHRAQGLIRAAWSQLQLLIRGCELENVAIGAASDPASVPPIGIVDSIFAPVLDPTVRSVQPHGGEASCGVELAGERLCDPRALCERVATGGVRCSCVGNGLRYKPAVSEDGRQCEQDATLRVVLESESVVIAVAKPGSLKHRTLNLIVEAHGEAELAVTLNVSMTLTKASFGVALAVNRSIRIDQASASAFGQHIEWSQLPPASNWTANLEGTQLKFVEASRHEFDVRLACDTVEHNDSNGYSDEQPCAADGDVIADVVQLASPLDGRLRSEVTVQTRVEALVSCNTSVAFVTSAGLELEGDSIATESPIEVRLLAKDVDDLEVRFTRAAIELLWEHENQQGTKVLFNTEVGTNEYTATISAASTKEPGRYTLSVRVVKGASDRVGNVGPCKVLRRSITVTADKTQLIIALVLIGVLVATVAVGGFLLYKNRERAKKFLLSFLLFEGVLAADVSFEAWDISGTSSPR
jgi:hypothetical protein